MLVANWSLFAYSHFAYSRFAYFRPKSCVSPTHKKIYLGTKWCQTTSWSIDLSLKMYLGHVKVISCAITGFVCTKSCSWEYLPVEVCWYSRSKPKQADSNWAVHYTARSWSQKPWKPLAEIRNLRCFEKITLDKYVQRISAHTNV